MIYYNIAMKVVKTTADIAYNEARVGIDSHSPHAHALCDVGVIPNAAENMLKLGEEFWLDVQDSPWTNVHKVSMTLGGVHPNLATVVCRARMKSAMMVE